jgi:hypothetical protein
MPAPSRAFPVSVVVEHYEPSSSGAVDGFGNPVLELVGRETLPANVQPQWTREVTGNQMVEMASFNMFFPAGTKIGAWDRVLFMERQLELFGASREFFDFSGKPHHTEAVGREVI